METQLSTALGADAALCPGCFDAPGDEFACPLCGYDSDSPRAAHLLAHGYLLHGQYLIGRVLGRPGGFGITYLAWDIGLRRRIAIKEFFPELTAQRAADGVEVLCRSAEQRADFDRNRQQFMAEARVLAGFDHPNILRLRSLFQANGSSYLVMDYFPGQILTDYLRESGSVLRPGAAIALLTPILSALQYLHDQGYLHRDVKPANIYLTQSGKPILLDFGAAQMTTSSKGDAMGVTISEGYAPIEQYGVAEQQGPWTDVYGAAATLYRMVTGHPPPNALDRIGNDMVATELRRRLPDNSPVAAAILRAMALHVADRTPSASMLIAELQAAQRTAGNQMAEPPAEPSPAPQDDAVTQSHATTRDYLADPDSLSSGLARARKPARDLDLLVPLLILGCGGLLATAILVDVGRSTGKIHASEVVVAQPRAGDPHLQSRTLERQSRADRQSAAQRRYLPELVDVPGGEYWQKQATSPVELPPFRMSSRKISGLRLQQFLDANPREPRSAGGCEQFNLDQPAICVSYYDAQAYTRWLSSETGRLFRLPTAAELDFIAQQGRQQVRRFKPMMAHDEQPRPFGVTDLFDPVREWTCSRFDPEDESAPLHCRDLRGSHEAIGYAANGAQQAETWHGVGLHTRGDDLGFRIVEEL